MIYVSQYGPWSKKIPVRGLSGMSCEPAELLDINDIDSKIWRSSLRDDGKILLSHLYIKNDLGQRSLLRAMKNRTAKRFRVDYTAGTTWFFYAFVLGIRFDGLWGDRRVTATFELALTGTVREIIRKKT